VCDREEEIGRREGWVHEGPADAALGALSRHSACGSDRAGTLGDTVADIFIHGRSRQALRGMEVRVLALVRRVEMGGGRRV
jgi:hypothetical protein